MAYLRWGDASNWYIYWTTCSGDTIDTQLLELMHAHVGEFTKTYDEVVTAMGDKDGIGTLFAMGERVLFTQLDLRQLREAASRWITDVKSEFPHRGRPRIPRKHQRNNR